MERTVLVVEDSPTQAERVRLLLEGEGYRVELARNGREALEQVRVALPDLIISDVVMPEMDGYAFCQAVKSSMRTRQTPFVLLTERNTPADFIGGLQHGADNFITKPYEDDYLLERVRRIFENLDLRRAGRLDVEVTLNLGGRQIVINADKQQMIELLFATLEELVRANGRLREAQRTVEEYAKNLEAKVQERTQQLLQTEKLATMGQLLAGVAHELNNPLSVVMGQTSLLRHAVREGPLAERADKIAQATARCTRIVRNFLALARQRPTERAQVRLNQVAQEAVELLAYQLRVDSVEVEYAMAPDLPPLWADGQQLHQVLVNLITNARQAMRQTPPPRRLLLATRYDQASDRVQLTVADTGPGIPPELEARIFDPFFTTKPLGEGTGLGLALCKSIVEEHGGQIWVESRRGQGATFVVELPVTPAPAAAPEPGPAEAPAAPEPRRILVVDDEPEIAELLAEVLSAEGHRVETVGDGATALERLRERGYDLVVSDLRMPGLDGPALYQVIQREAPALARRFIFITGDALGRQVEEFLEQSQAPSIGKPFSFEEVRRVVRRVLKGAR